MPTSLLLIRHGAVDSPIGPEGPLIYGPKQPLNTQGQHQIIRLGQNLKDSGIVPDVIYTSPFIRAVQSAELLRETLPNHPPIIIREALRGSYSPQWNLRPESEAKGITDLFADNPKLPEIHGETLSDAYARILREFQTLHASHPDQTIALVTHYEIIGLLRHYLKTRDSNPSVDSAIEKGEGLLYRVSPEGDILEERKISPELQQPHPERHG